MTFLSDAGGHLDLGINLEWPKLIICLHILETLELFMLMEGFKSKAEKALDSV